MHHVCHHLCIIKLGQVAESCAQHSEIFKSDL
jgi:hypothetical protein